MASTQKALSKEVANTIIVVFGTKGYNYIIIIGDLGKREGDIRDSVCLSHIL